MWFMMNTCFSSGRRAFWRAKSAYMNYAPIKPLDFMFQTVSWAETRYPRYCISLLEGECRLCGPFRKNTGSLHVDSSRLCPICLFPLLIYPAVNLCCVVKINLSYDYDHMLSLMNSSIDTPIVQVVMGLLRQVHHKW